MTAGSSVVTVVEVSPSTAPTLSSSQELPVV